MGKDHGPSIQDDERYEALREEGMSKEKAARIANTPPREMKDEAGRVPTRTGPRSSCTRRPKK